MKKNIIQFSLLFLLSIPVGLTEIAYATNNQTVQTTKNTKKSVEEKAQEIIEEFLNTAQNPKKTYAQYIDQLCTILSANPKYNNLIKKLRATTKLKRHTAVSTQLLKLKQELPETIFKVLNTKGPGRLLKILKARIQSR